MESYMEYEQHESLTTRIKNIIKDYPLPLDKLIKEFLQNADDAKATRFSVIIDRRQHNAHKKSLLSEDMKDLQGPAIWIYNDAVFSKEDFQGLTEIGGKSRDKNDRIGKFGIGFSCSFHVTDLPSLVSGEHIVFLDPHKKFLPPTGYPPRSRNGVRINFIENEFKKSFPDQCHPYKDIEGCDFTKEFKGTLFRLPLRTRKLALQSKISNQVSEIKEILRTFNRTKSNEEMLFLRNIESCSLYDMSDRTSQLVWRANINNSDNCRSSRQNVIDSIDNAQIYQLEIESENYVENKKVSEIWAICTGGHDSIKSDLRKFSKESRLKPRGGVASLLASSDEKSLDELKAESFPNSPKLRGEMFSYLSISMVSDLGVHLNGNFSLNSARLQSEYDFLQSDCIEAKWNKYILLEVLPDLHVKLLEYIVELEKERHKKERSSFIPHITSNLWPINRDFIGKSFENYGLNVIRKLGLNDKKFFWTEANGGQFVSLREAKILDKEKAVIVDILVNSGISAVKLDTDKVRQLKEIVESGNPPNFPYRPISGESVCKELPMKIFSTHSFNIHDPLFKLLDFILQDESSFEILTGLQLVPLSNGSVGRFGEVYYIGKQKYIELFPNIGSSKFVLTSLPENLSKIFNYERFSAFTNIKKFDASSVLDLLMYELRPLKELKWDPDGKSIPNSNWLEKIWSILKNVTEKEFTRLSKFPLLPIIQPSNKLIRIDMTNPPLYGNGHTLYHVLVKLGVRFTDMIFPENAHENLKKCVDKCTPVNIINALERVCSSSYLTMKELFNKNHLDDHDYVKLKTFIKAEIDILIEHGKNHGNFMDILKSLPIWPIHSSENKFIDATSGALLTYKLPSFFSFYQDTSFYKFDNELDFNALTKLGATSVNELEYVKQYIVPPLATIFPDPSQEYIIFLRSVLSLRNRELEQCLKPHLAIPNRSDTNQTFVRADDLYDINVPLFRSIFANTDKILPPELQNNSTCLGALRRMGLKRQVNCDVYIECAQEIESQISQIQQNWFLEDAVKDRAKNLVQHLYEHTETLNFNTVQWNKIIRIKFVPSEKNLQNITSGFESFEKLCSHKYKKICWTQCPLFDKSVEPTISFSEQHPEIGTPSVENIIEHLFVIVKMSKKRTWSGSKSELKDIIKATYEEMNKISNDRDNKMLIELKTANKKVFLNGDDPFNEKNWVARNELVFGVQEDIREGMHKVKDCLINYRNLFIDSDPNNKDYDSKDDEFDVTFVVGGKTNINASKHVLSASSTYFERMFRGSGTNKINVMIMDVQPDTFTIFIRWIYGQSFDEATKSVLCEHEDYHLTFLVDLLKLTDRYNVINLKDEVEKRIVNGTYINVSNVHEMLKWSFECCAMQLRDYCEKYIMQNKRDL